MISLFFSHSQVIQVSILFSPDASGRTKPALMKNQLYIITEAMTVCELVVDLLRRFPGETDDQQIPTHVRGQQVEHMILQSHKQESQQISSCDERSLLTICEDLFSVEIRLRAPSQKSKLTQDVG